MFETVLMVLLALSTLSGCARSPERSYYTLRSDAAAPTSADRPGSPGIPRTVVIDSLTVPETVDRVQMVTRKAGTAQLDISDSHRWAEPLSAEIAAVLADSLSTHLRGALVIPPNQSAYPTAPDRRIRVDITRFEGVLGQSVSLEAVYVIPKSEVRAGYEGRSRIEERMTSADYDGLTLAYRRALDRLGQEMALRLER